MIRLYREMAETLLMLLLFIKDRGVSLRDVRNYAEENWYRVDTRNATQEETVAVVRYALESPSADPPTFDSLIKTLVSQLRAKVYGDSRKEGDLIDRLVRALGLPYSRNVIGGSTMDALKKALLLPEELAGLNKRLTEKEKSCGMCGHNMERGDLASIFYDGTGYIIVCANCSTPSHLPCGYCGTERIPLSSETREVLRPKERCKKCARKEEGKALGANDITITSTGIFTNARLRVDGPPNTGPSRFLRNVARGQAMPHLQWTPPDEVFAPPAPPPSDLLEPEDFLDEDLDHPPEGEL